MVLLIMVSITDISAMTILVIFLFMVGAALFNVIPFVILLAVHSRRIRNKNNPRDYSFNAAYVSTILAMLIAVLLLLIEAGLAHQVHN